MVAACLVQVRSDVLVTVQAQTVLRRLVKRLVAFLARTLDACVLRDDLTGHDERLDP